jgi:hypothetical protein
MRPLRFFMWTLPVAATLTACPSAKTLENAANRGGGSGCGRLDDEDCAKVRGMLSAMDAFSNVHEELVLDVQNTFVHPEAKIDPNAIDFSFIGVAVDEAIVDGHVPASQVVQVGGEARLYTLRLLAVAFAHDLDPQPSCAVRYGGMLSYETTVKGVELRAGTVLDIVTAKLFAPDSDVRQVTVGGLEVSGLDERLEERRPLDFKVKNPVPIAHPVHPVRCAP